MVVLETVDHWWESRLSSGGEIDIPCGWKELPENFSLKTIRFSLGEDMSHVALAHEIAHLKLGHQEESKPVTRERQLEWEQEAWGLVEQWI